MSHCYLISICSFVSGRRVRRESREGSGCSLTCPQNIAEFSILFSENKQKKKKKHFLIFFFLNLKCEMNAHWHFLHFLTYLWIFFTIKTNHFFMVGKERDWHLRPVCQHSLRPHTVLPPALAPRTLCGECRRDDSWQWLTQGPLKATANPEGAHVKALTQTSTHSAITPHLEFCVHNFLRTPIIRNKAAKRQHWGSLLLFVCFFAQVFVHFCLYPDSHDGLTQYL